MLTAYVPKPGALERRALVAGDPPPHGAVWFDLLSPTPEEDHLVEQLLGIGIPTRDEMREIEPSSRLYEENGARYMTATMMCASDTPQPKTTEVSFILSAGKLVTVRYDDPRPFGLLSARLERTCPHATRGENVLIDLLDAVIDRAADLLERTSTEVDGLSRRIFEPDGGSRNRSRIYQDILKEIGRKGDLTSKIRESLVSVGRLVTYLATHAEGEHWSKEMRLSIKSMQRDCSSLSDHSSYLGDKVVFLLDAMLGIVNIEQSNIIKLFSVVAVIFLPPTLVASIYGMNFDVMPELKWPLGYPFALVLMVVSAILPYVFFRWKKWL